MMGAKIGAFHVTVAFCASDRLTVTALAVPSVQQSVLHDIQLV